MPNTDKELAKQANKISEWMKSFEKTDSSVKGLWGIADDLLWFIVGKNGKAQATSEPNQKPQEAKKVNSFNC